jgi:hypothetical protein
MHNAWIFPPNFFIEYFSLQTLKHLDPGKKGNKLKITMKSRKKPQEYEKNRPDSRGVTIHFFHKRCKKNPSNFRVQISPRVKIMHNAWIFPPNFFIEYFSLQTSAKIIHKAEKNHRSMKKIVLTVGV